MYEVRVPCALGELDRLDRTCCSDVPYSVRARRSHKGTAESDADLLRIFGATPWVVEVAWPTRKLAA